MLFQANQNILKFLEVKQFGKSRVQKCVENKNLRTIVECCKQHSPNWMTTKTFFFARKVIKTHFNAEYTSNYCILDWVFQPMLFVTDRNCHLPFTIYRNESRDGNGKTSSYQSRYCKTATLLWSLDQCSYATFFVRLVCSCLLVRFGL